MPTASAALGMRDPGGGNGTNDLTFYLNGQEVIDTPDNVLTIGEWQHAAVRYTSNGDGTGTARMYLNGVEIATGNYTNGAVVDLSCRNACSSSSGRMLFSGASNCAWPSGLGGTSSQGSSTNIGARSDATKADHRLLSACKAGTGRICRGGLADAASNAGSMATRTGTISSR